MGLKKDWLNDVEFTLKNENIPFHRERHECFHLLFIGNCKLLLNLMSLSRQYSPDSVIALQQEYESKNIQMIHLWEDVWRSRPLQVLSRLRSMLIMNLRIHGRKTRLERVSKAEAESFLNQYHLQGSVNSRYAYGLYFQRELVAVATFSNKRKMRDRGEDFYSAELIRFATKSGSTVIGGLSKLVQHYIGLHRPSDLMSYADRDWSLGNSYISSGFTLVAITSPIMMYVDTKTWVRCVKAKVSTVGSKTAHIKVFNTGNLKYVLNLK